MGYIKMASHYNIESLIKQLQKLYRQVTARVLKNRIDSYRGDAKGASEFLSTSLHTHVDGLDRANEQSVVKKGNSDVAPEDSERSIDKSGGEASQHQGPFIFKMLKGFQHYLRQKKKAPTLQPHLSQKLKDSTWEQVHTAIRQARQGDLIKARLHVDIAMNALDELAHYLPDDAYLLFRSEIKDQIDNIRQLSN